MIHVVTAGNRGLYADALAEMHRLRRVHFVEERGWSALTVRDGGEYDQYDDEQAIYLLCLEEDGRLSCSMRMRPARDASMLTDIFPHLVAADEPSLNRNDVWEISRFFAAAHCRGRGGARRRAEVRLAALEVARSRGINRLIGMIDLEMLPPMLDGSGWRVRPLGLPAPYDEGIAQAIEVQVSQGAVEEMVETLGLEPGVCLELEPARTPLLPPHEIETLLRLAQTSSDRSRILVALVRRILALQDEADEAEILGMVAYVEALVNGETGVPQ